MGVEIMSEQYDKKVEELERVESAQHEARGITKDAKYLCYPITDIAVKLSSLADEHGLEKEMEYALDEVREAQRKLESAFFRCEDVFYELEIKEREYD